MLRKKSLFLLMALIALLISSCGKQQRVSLSVEEKTAILNGLADSPSTWRGWKLLHRENTDWTDHKEYQIDVKRPTAHPPGNDTPFFLIDDSRKITPEYAAQCMIQGMIHCTRANRCGDGFVIVDYKVPEQKLFQREDIIHRALNDLELSEASNFTKDQFIESARSFLEPYPGIGNDMWLLYPDFSIKWTGKLMGADYGQCQREGLSDQAGLVGTQSISSHAGQDMANLFLLIRQDNRYRLQSVAGFFAEYEKSAPQP